MGPTFGPKSGLKLGFPPFSLVWFISFPLNCIEWSLVEVKLSKKIFWVQKVFWLFLKFASLVFLDIAQDCSLGQCLTSSRAETSKKNLWPKLGKLGPNRSGSGQNEVSQNFLSYFIKRGKISLNWYFISIDYRIFFTYNPTASFIRHRIVEWPEIEFKMRPMLFKKCWNLFYSNVECPVKLVCLFICPSIWVSVLEFVD